MQNTLCTSLRVQKSERTEVVLALSDTYVLMSVRHNDNRSCMHTRMRVVFVTIAVACMQLLANMQNTLCTILRVQKRTEVVLALSDTYV